MKRLITIAAVCCALAAAWLQRDTGQPRPAPDPSWLPEPSATVDPDTWQYDLAPALATDGSGPAGRPDDGTEVILGIRVRKDRNCEVELNDYVTTTGEMFSAYTCTPPDPVADHPYAHYSDEALREIAFGDADAAALLGERLLQTNRQGAYQMLVRATALDGNARHLAWLADAAFGRYRVDGELQVDNVMRQYELAALAAHFGENAATRETLREELREAGVSKEQLIRLDRRVEELLQTTGDIQRDVYGEVRYGGQPDA